ncbi:MoaD/ThiS family protein [Sulfurospirillum deleyianum]|uniref:ThiamineS protein n=1 Tax=Sulfurospirillum deleyianum (strain ATCC 51133 / DSM 6946 / 5175) TaxID=525898 RepID=D1B3P6_SULD5|nr:MoaD/ThiS family protein [Sulfurospirillum deleyianum]ACZ12716.1 thiamineS protein [Sulfurospirillum deleyianum DSM 6946]
MYIILNAFSFLREKLKQKGIPYLDAQWRINEQTRICDLIDSLGLEQNEVEAVFLNHTVTSKETLLKEGDRVALLPPGTPGSYRLLSGLKEH